MKVDTVITLSNADKYLLLDKVELNDKNYFYAVKLNEDMSDATDEYKFFEEIQKESKTSIKEVKDKEIIEYLLTTVVVDYTELVHNINEEEKNGNK